MQFHIIINGKSVGPHTKEEVESMLDDGSLRPNDQIWHEDLEGWQSIEEVFDIKTVKSPPPVPLSPRPPPLPASPSIRSAGRVENESPPSKEQTKTSKTIVLVSIAAVSVVALTFIGQVLSTIDQTTTDLNDGNDITKRNHESIKKALDRRSEKLDSEMEELNGRVQSSNSIDEPNSAPSVQETSDVSTMERGEIGDTVQFADSKWIVEKAQNLGNFLNGGDFFEGKRSSGKFVFVEFRIVNTTNEEEQILFTPKLVDSNGRKFNQMSESILYLPDGSEEMTLSQLPPGVTKTFRAIYEVAGDASGLSFEARSLGFRPKYALISLDF
jgi:hypothetical protein